MPSLTPGEITNRHQTMIAPISISQTIPTSGISAPIAIQSTQVDAEQASKAILHS
jgi:hypothetical protein